jgi:hypothetical protein
MGDMLAAIIYMVIAAVLPALLLRLFSRGFGWRSRVLSVALALGTGWVVNFLYLTEILGPLYHARFIESMSKREEPRYSDLQHGCDAWMGLLLPIASAMYVLQSTKWFGSNSSLSQTLRPDELTRRESRGDAE